ncbi:MAG: transglycosylase SLT domain-containing protein [Bacteroidota bacterium]
MAAKLIGYLFPLLILILSCESSPQQEEAPQALSSNSQDVKHQDAVDEWEPYNVWDSLLIRLAEEKDIDWMLAKAIVIKESHMDAYYLSYAGAAGLMQLMPREGSFINSSYRNYLAVRKQKRKTGVNSLNGKSDREWASLYVSELQEEMQRVTNHPDSLPLLDKRFDPEWNVRDGIRQFTSDYSFFRARKHSHYTASLLAIAAYNAGRYAVMKDKLSPSLDRIPINKQTELYVAFVWKIYQQLQEQEGKINKANEWVVRL